MMLPFRSDSRGRAPWTEAALGLARLQRDALRRQREFGIGKHPHALAPLRKQFAVFANPARDHGLGEFFDPLLKQGRDLLAQVGGVIQT